MSLVTVWHKLKDYSTWKALFDGDEARRKEAGLKVLHVGPGKMDPNSAFVVIEGENAGPAMEGMFADPDLKAKMEEGGVLEVDFSVSN